jgi:imidazolonepropionase-like amidohydrolase
MGWYQEMRLFLPASIALFSTFALAQQPLLIEHVRVFDGTRVIDNTNVLIDGGVIRAVGPKVAKPAGADVLDGTGKTLLPGLIDSHVHAYAPDSLKQALAFGVTTVLDMFTDPKFAAQIKKEEADGKDHDLADIRSAGVLVTAPGGHGTEYGIKIPTISDPSEAQAFVDARIAEGSDYIKLVDDDAREYGLPPRPTLSVPTMKAVIEAAHKRGKLAVVHIGSEAQARDAIDAGADGLVHLFVGASAGSDFGALAAQHHAFVIPTFSVLHAICGDPSGAALAKDPHIEPMLTPAAAVSLESKFPMSIPISCDGAAQAVKQLKAAHVPILAGTDAGNPGTTYGASEHGEMANLVRAGLSPIEALQAATSVPARAFHLDDRGAIAQGKRADLLLVNGDPTKNIEATRDIVAVWKQGARLDLAAYRSSVQADKNKVKAQASTPPPPGSESGLVSDFENGDKPSALFGSWDISTDTIAGGKSTAEMKIVPVGANGSKGALDVSGEVVTGFSYAWAGVMFSPASGMMQPANLSAKKEISFWAKGEPRTYRLMVFAQNLGFMPAQKTFDVTPEWKEFTFSLAAFQGVDPHVIMGVVFCGGPAPGKFEFQLDDVRFR